MVYKIDIDSNVIIQTVNSMMIADGIEFPVDSSQHWFLVFIPVCIHAVGIG